MAHRAVGRPGWKRHEPHPGEIYAGRSCPCNSGGKAGRRRGYRITAGWDDPHHSDGGKGRSEVRTGIGGGIVTNMPRPRPPHLHREINRHGNAVWYVRVGKGPRIRIRAEYGRPEFEQAYQAAIE